MKTFAALVLMLVFMVGCSKESSNPIAPLNYSIQYAVLTPVPASIVYGDDQEKLIDMTWCSAQMSMNKGDRVAINAVQLLWKSSLRPQITVEVLADNHVIYSNSGIIFAKIDTVL